MACGSLKNRTGLTGWTGRVLKILLILSGIVFLQGVLL
ncbi:hypothetical protein KKC1_22360 [Calderihabitans maritimus]|uniref:Uncharacterized protein n=1 Tax=Calderihabitans maritimus TaxID=1246530 RepID=A0A1Z5HUT8_9FIRM|nr:hypothetical protein KKC1_22360 [Calderihabitans maritimus]